jgi:predicted alpha/beta-hydrolase family hydrolase
VSSTQVVATSVGDARITWHPSAQPHAVLALGHGSATGIDSPDLQALAATLPAHGITVALVEQPWLVSGSYTTATSSDLDTAWRELWPHLEQTGLLVIVGGRSAGSQVAVRTARELDAQAILALAYPLYSPGSREELLNTDLPTLIVQGGDDPFGRPADFPRLPPKMEMVEILDANHTFTSRRGNRKTLKTITAAVIYWLERQQL